MYWAALGMPWVVLGLSWACLGLSWACLGIWIDVGTLLGYIWGLFGNNLGIYFDFWGHSGVNCRTLLSWACLGLSWAYPSERKSDEVFSINRCVVRGTINQPLIELTNGVWLVLSTQDKLVLFQFLFRNKKGQFERDRCLVRPLRAL